MSTSLQLRRGTTAEHTAFTGLNAEITVDTGLKSIRLHDGVTPGGTIIGGAGAAPNRNKLRNGNFAINQRNVSGTVTLAAGAYGHDGFKAGAGGCTYTFAKTANKTTITVTAGTLLQIVDGANLQSGTYTIGYNGTAPVRLNGGAWGASGLTDSTVVGGVNQTVEWGIGTLSLVQYEPGTVRTVFDFRDGDAELARCQWYLRLLTNRIIFNGAVTYDYACYVTVPFPQMRTAPSVIPITLTANSALNATTIVGTGVDWVRFNAMANTIDPASAVMYGGGLLTSEQ